MASTSRSAWRLLGHIGRVEACGALPTVRRAAFVDVPLSATSPSMSSSTFPSGSCWATSMRVEKLQGLPGTACRSMSAESTPPEPPSARAMVPPDVAFELIFEVGWESKHSYLDVRTPEEFAVSRPQGAVIVPFMLKSAGASSTNGSSSSGADKSLGMKTGGLKMVENGRFLEDVRELFSPGTMLIVGSANKDRRALAALAVLSKAGFNHALAMQGGCRAWIAAGLPVDPEEEEE